MAVLKHAALGAVLPSLIAAASIPRQGSTCLPPYVAQISGYIGCYSDPVTPRPLSGLSLSPGQSNSPEYCATLCGNAGFSLAGVEYTVQCFCGNEIGPAGHKSDESSCSSPCPANASVTCGAANFMNVYQISNPNPEPVKGFLPDCTHDPLCSNPICDTSLSMAERAAGIINALTLDEKIGNVQNAAAGSPRLGLPPYQWWSEALHGVASSPGVTFQESGNFSYATSFPMPIFTSAAFDDPLVLAVGQTVGKEGRAFGNAGQSGFDFWTPNINPFRDPRWGRGMETPGEDPLHIESYVYNLVTGMQGGVDPPEKQIISTCKHYAAYDIENGPDAGRNSNDLDPSQQDMADYYLRPFKSCVREAKGGSIMCSYNAVNGAPSCANEYLLQRVLREEWNFTAPYNWVVSDCDAVGDVFNNHKYTTSLAAGSAVSLNAGTDLDCGTTYASLSDAIKYNMTTEAILDKSLNRLYSSLIQIGWFDTTSQYSSVGWSDVNTPDAQSLAYQAAIEGLTLLKNDGTLPLRHIRSGATIALIGPWANATTQMQGNYQGVAPYLISPLAAFQKHFENVVYEEGTAIDTTSTDNFAAAIAAAKDADYVFYMGGIDTTIESEGHDRTTIVWPGNQLDLISQLAEVSKHFVVVQFGGGQIDDSALLSNTNVHALLWAGYPGQSGGDAVFDGLTGTVAVAGRLPITQYPANYTDVPIFNMNLRPSTGYPGRTYKWYNEAAVIPFGFGLHYTDWTLSWASAPKKSYSIQDLVKGATGAYKELTPFVDVVVDIKNSGPQSAQASDYVALLFISTTDGGPAPYPIKDLVAYARAHDITVRATKSVTLPLTLASIARVDTDGNKYIFPGTYTLAVDIDAKITTQFTLTGDKELIEALPPYPYNATGFEYLGCYSDTGSFNGKSIDLGETNYPQLCVDQCKAAGFDYSAVKGSTCLCNGDFSTTTSPSSDSNCNTACPGDSYESCGADKFINVYNATLPTFIQPPTDPPPS
ncbi:glycoside hydrolase superfamily [Xylogone sp. PMI_703]|nr:glycoside hydrolase superfamily [Xylogone sp. PMI_703]